jgi:arsenate reductase (thioredoxin)
MKPTVLFLCVHNAGRSQMAAGFMRHIASDQVEVRSAGSEPADDVNPVAVAAMAEIGIDIALRRPRRWTAEEFTTTDVVVTMGCGDECPFVPGTRHVDWPLDDPAGQGIEMVRRVRDDIEARVRHLIAELLPSATSQPPVADSAREQ